MSPQPFENPSAQRAYNELADAVGGFIAEHRERFIALSDAIWGFAEIGYEEFRSAAAQRAILAEFGFALSGPLAGMPTAFFAEAGEGGPLLALLGEFDALPNIDQTAGVARREGDPARNGHACGHHLLGTAAVLAAIAAADYLRRRGLPGRIRYYACPAEENGIGKGFIARAGLFSDVAAALTWHPGAATGIMSGPIIANMQAYFRFTGRAAHASTAPHLGRSALDAVELMNVGVNYLREHIPTDARVHYAVTDTGGRAPNVVQAHAEVLYLVRAETADGLKSLYRRVCRIAEGAALMTETQLEIRFDKATAPMLHNAVLDQRFAAIVEVLGAPAFDAADQALAGQFRATLGSEELAAGKRRFLIPADYDAPLVDRPMPYVPSHASVGGSTDVADVSWVIPTTQIWGSCLAIGTPGHSWQNVAQGRSSYAHKGMLHTAKLLAVAALDLLRDAATLAAARRELDASLAVSGTPDLLPADVVPPVASSGR